VREESQQVTQAKEEMIFPFANYAYFQEMNHQLMANLMIAPYCLPF
jgi:hypothetical protein